eukprot:2911457-Prymnesium_polylepis.1
MLLVRRLRDIFVAALARAVADRGGRAVPIAGRSARVAHSCNLAAVQTRHRATDVSLHRWTRMFRLMSCDVLVVCVTSSTVRERERGAPTPRGGNALAHSDRTTKPARGQCE